MVRIVALGSLLSLLSVATAQVSFCGSAPAPRQVLQAEGGFAQALRDKADLLARGEDPFERRAAPVIPIHFNVILSSNSTAASAGYITSANLATQLSVMNSAFSASGLSFTLGSTRYIVNAAWFNNATQGNSLQTQMKTSLRQGGVTALNVYTVAFTISPGLGGYATFPWSYTSAPTDDGIVINYQTFPGGALTGFNTGDILVHETGHWVGLYHTFQGGCATSATDGGDYVADTPASASPSSGCPTGRDSCPTIAGLDPINNFMDYSNGACMTHFTAGQVTRLQQAMNIYRGVTF